MVSLTNSMKDRGASILGELWEMTLAAADARQGWTMRCPIQRTLKKGDPKERHSLMTLMVKKITKRYHLLSSYRKKESLSLIRKLRVF